jgi:hypothetical protein
VPGTINVKTTKYQQFAREKLRDERERFWILCVLFKLLNVSGDEWRQVSRELRFRRDESVAMQG